MSTIYELTGEMLTLQEMAEDEDVDMQTLIDTMEMVNLDFEDKAEGYAEVIKNLQAEIDGYKKEIERMSLKKTAIENHIETMKKTLEKAMIATGKTKFKTRLFSFNIQKNPPSAHIIFEKEVPEEFWIKHDPTINKRAIIEYLKEFGNTEWAELEQSESLRIR